MTHGPTHIKFISSFIILLVLRVCNPSYVTEGWLAIYIWCKRNGADPCRVLGVAARKFIFLKSSIMNLSRVSIAMWTPFTVLVLLMNFYSHNNGTQAQKGSRDSAVFIVTRIRTGYLRELGSICVSSKRFFPSPKSTCRPAVSPSKLPTTWPPGIFIRE